MSPSVGQDTPLSSVSALMTVQEVALIFRRSDRTIRTWVRDGRLRPIRVGRSVFFRREDVEALLRPSEANDDHSASEC